jgi:Protein of unknown function (DUF2786)
MTNDIIDRIHKLLNMTSAKGCTEDEAETALRMAAGLMAKHGIQEDQLNKAEIKNLARIGRRVSQDFKRYQLLTAQAAGELFGCKMVLYGRGKYGFEFIGRPDNLEAAESTMFWLLEQLERFYKEALPRGMTVSARAKYRKTFKEACALRVFHRAVSLMNQMSRDNEAAQSATGSTALVVEGHFKRLARENEEMMASHYGDIREGRAMRFTSGSGTADGHSAGDRVKLRKELQ